MSDSVRIGHELLLREEEKKRTETRKRIFRGVERKSIEAAYYTFTAVCVSSLSLSPFTFSSSLWVIVFLCEEETRKSRKRNMLKGWRWTPV